VRPRLIAAIEVLVVAILYYASASLGLLLALDKTNASPVWPPSGIALAAMLLLGYRACPGIMVGAFVANVHAFFANQAAADATILAVSAAIAMGNTLEAVVGRLILRRLVLSGSPFDRAAHVLKFTLTALLMCLVSASIGPTAIVVAGMAPDTIYGTIWFTWWLGDVTGVLLVAPVLVTWARRSQPPWAWRTRLEAALVFGSLLVAAHIGFGGWPLDKDAHYPLVFVPIPWLVWVACRFGPREAATAAAMTSVLAVWDTAHGFGPFVRETVNTSLLLLQAFAGIVTVTILTMAAVVAERRQAEARLQEAFGNSEARVRERTQELVRVNEVMKAQIIQREQMEEALRAAEASFRNLVEFAPDAMVIANGQGAIVLVNSQVERLFGYARRELVGQPVEILVPARFQLELRRRQQRLFANLHLRTTATSTELYGLRKDGAEFSAEISLGPLKSGEETFVSSVIRDVTERKRAEQSLQQTEKLAAMSALLAGVAHELNNPLAVVAGQAELLHRGAGSGPLAERAAKIARAANRCARTVRNFLSLARHHPPERQLVRLNDLVREAVEVLAYPLGVDDVEVQLDLAAELPIVWADPHQLHQVVVNLITNAHQAMRAQSGPRRLTLMTGHDADACRLRLAVADTGPGIPSEIQGRIFQPFFTTKPLGQGTGLGLALCREIVGAHGGTIHVESRPGAGATFRLELPLATPADAVQTPADESLPPIPNKAILVVDDEPEVGAVLADTLADDGHQVETAANGAEALNRLGERAFDLILSDIKMPVLDGPGLYRELGKRHPELRQRMIFVTGDTMSAETRAFLSKTGAPCLNKPAVADVCGVVRRVLHASSLPTRLHHRRHPPVEVDGGAGDVTGALGGQEGDEIGELFGLAHPSHRHAPGHVLVVGLHVALGSALPLGALDQAEADGVDEDPIGGVLAGQRLGEIDAGGARDRCGQATRSRRLAADGGHVDDAPTAPPLHVRDDQAAEAHGGHQLQIEVLLPGGVVHLAERGGRRRARVVDEHVHAAEARQHGAHERLHVGQLGDVGRLRQHLGAGGFANRLGGALEHVLPTRADGHARALAREPFPARPPQPLAASGDDRHLAAESELQHGPVPPA